MKRNLEKNLRILPLLFGLILASCGGKSGPEYVLTLAPEAEEVYEYGASFKDDSLLLVDKATNKTVKSVVSTMLIGFSTEKTDFAITYSAKVSYNGQNYPFDYKITSKYTADKTYNLVLALDGIEVTSIKNPSSSATEFTIPETINTLPSAFKNVPLTKWSASLSELTSLSQLHLSANLLSFAPEGEVRDTVEVLPNANGHLHYDSGGFFSLSNVLWGLSPNLSGAVSLPSSCTSFAKCAFAGERALITALTIPASYPAPNFTKLSYHFPNNEKFILSSTSPYYSTPEGFIYWANDSEVSCRGIPAGKVCTNQTLSFSAGLKRFTFDNLYGISNPTMKNLLFPDSLTSFGCNTNLSAFSTCPVTTLTFQSAAVVTTGSIDLSYLPSTITSIKVPSSLLASYQADSYWKKVADKISAIA